MPSVYFEFTVQGAYIKVAAIDADSGLEVSIVGAVGTPQSELERVALRKLDQALKKQLAAQKQKGGRGTLA